MSPIAHPLLFLLLLLLNQYISSTHAQQQDPTCDIGTIDQNCGDSLNIPINGFFRACNSVLTACPGGFPQSECNANYIPFIFFGVSRLIIHAQFALNSTASTAARKLAVRSRIRGRAFQGGGVGDVSRAALRLQHLLLLRASLRVLRHR